MLEYDDAIFQIDLDRVREIAAARQALHLNHRSRRALSDDYEIYGVAGEMAFSKWSFHPMDESSRPGGDQYDFLIRERPIDIKTAQKAYYLLVEPRRLKKDMIYVLAQFNPPDRVHLLGWQTGLAMSHMPIRDFGRGIPSHFQSRSTLRSMDALWNDLRLHTEIMANAAHT